MPELLSTLFAEQTVAELALVAAAVALGGFIRGFVGFGAALILVMILSLVFGPKVAVPVSSLSGLVVTLQLLPTAVRAAERPFVVPFALATFVAAPFGTWVLVAVDPALMRITISVFVLIVVAMLYRDWRLANEPGRAALVGTGVAAGLIQGAAGVGGPPVVGVALSRPGSAEQQRANVIGVIAALAVCNVPALWYYGLYTRDVVIISALIVPIYVASAWVGERYFSGAGNRHFRNAALVTLAAIGVVTLAVALRDFLNV